MDQHDPASPVPDARPKRRLMLALLGLHALSLAAASILAVRARRVPESQAETKASLLSLDSRDAVGWVTIRGPISASASGRPWDRGAEQTARRIEQLAETKGVKAIVLDINSPGGSVGAVQEIHSRILRVRREKHIPVVALFGDVAASGGYYLGAACDKIVAHPGSLTGSIGVIFSVSNLQGLFQKIGYRMEPIKSGKHKDIGSPARPMTPEERAILQSLIDDAYGQFVQAVAEGRGMTVAKVKPLADGRIYSGGQALAAGLVDQLGDSRDALKLAARLGGIKDEKPRVRREAERFGDLLELLESRARVSLGVGPVSLPLPEALSDHGLLYLWSGW